MVGRHRLSVWTADGALADLRPYPALRPGQKAAIALGSGLEFYDFSVFGFFAVPIGQTFFPAADPRTALLLSVGTIGVGYFARPLGALVIGQAADRCGRKPAMLATILLMAFATLGIAVLPGYAALGILSPLLLLALRLLQGFALGGETGPSVALLLETVSRERRGSAVAWQVAINGAALLAAGMVGLVLHLCLPAGEWSASGWRLAVLLGLGVVPVGLTLRASLPDGVHGRRPLPPAIWRPLLARPGRLVAATLVIASGTVAFSVGGLMTSYALVELHCSPAIAYLAAASLGVSTVVIAPLGGRLADRLGGRIAVVLSRLSLALLGWPAFMWLTGGGGSTALLAVSAGLAAASTLGTPATFCLIADSVRPASHATGLALVYALGISLFGGATQPAAVALLAWTGDPRSTAWLLVGAGIISMVATLLLPRQSAWPAVRNPVAPAPGSQRTSA